MRYSVLVLCLLANLARADVVYNPDTEAYEPGQTLKYNYSRGEREGAYRTDVYRYDVKNNEYRYADQNAVNRYNPYTNRYELVPANSELKYNARTQQYQYQRPTR